MANSVIKLDGTTYHKGDSVTVGGVNSMYAGRVGWSGKRILFLIPLPKDIGPDVGSIQLSFESLGTIYFVTSNNATEILPSSFTVTAFSTGNGVSVQMDFSEKPLSINDGVVNVMLNKYTTISFS